MMRKDQLSISTAESLMLYGKGAYLVSAYLSLHKNINNNGGQYES